MKKKIKEVRMVITCSHCGMDNWVFRTPDKVSFSDSKECTYCKKPIQYFISVRQDDDGK